MLVFLLVVASTTLLGQLTTGAVDHGCTDCICANSGGRTGGPAACKMPAPGPTFCLNGQYCGPYGMSMQYWIDAGSQGTDFYSCMEDWGCSNKTLNSYIDKYCEPQFVGHQPPCTCQEVARIHHCGPWSINAPFCNTYWGVMYQCLHPTPYTTHAP